jgi:hypothetical protein
MRIRCPFAGIAALTALACRQSELPAADNLVIVTLDTIVPVGNSLLGRPTELAVDERGSVFVNDPGLNVIQVLDSTGAMLRQIGRAGRGPGELQSPRTMTVAHDTLRVLDAGNARVALFLTSGPPVRAIPAPPNATGGPVAINESGAMIVGREGRDPMLAFRFSSTAEPGSRFGRRVVEAPMVWNFKAIKQQIRDGKVPLELRNHALPVLAADGSAWLLLAAEGVIERYSATDSLEWHVAYVEPEFTKMRQEFFAQNQSDSSANSFTSLSYFTTAHVVGRDLWVLTGPSAGVPTLLLVVAPDGSVRRRIRIPSAVGVRDFGLSPDRRLLYLLAYDDATIVRARLPLSR